MTRRSWLDSRIALVLDELQSFGLTTSRASAAADIQKRISSISEQVGVSERTAKKYITNDVIKDIARDIADRIKHEAENSNPSRLTPTHTVPTHVVGHTIAGLAIISQLILLNRPSDDGDLNAENYQPTGLIFEWGNSLTWIGNPSAAYVPPELIHKTAEELERWVQIIREGAQLHKGSNMATLMMGLERNIIALQTHL